MRTILIVLASVVLLASTVTVQAQEQQATASPCLSKEEVQQRLASDRVWQHTPYLFAREALDGVTCVRGIPHGVVVERASATSQYNWLGPFLVGVVAVRRGEGPIPTDVNTDPKPLPGSLIVTLEVGSLEVLVAVRRFEKPVRIVSVPGPVQLPHRYDCQYGFEARRLFAFVCTVTSADKNQPPMVGRPYFVETTTTIWGWEALAPALGMIRQYRELFQALATDAGFWDTIAPAAASP